MRLPHWELKFKEVIEEARNKPFVYGQHDCATFALDVRRAITGKDDISGWRGTYSSATGAAKVLRRLDLPSMEAVANRFCGEVLPSPLFAQRGDIVQADNEALGVCLGSHAVFVSAEGLDPRPLCSCVKAWRVD